MSKMAAWFCKRMSGVKYVAFSDLSWQKWRPLCGWEQNWFPVNLKKKVKDCGRQFCTCFAIEDESHRPNLLEMLSPYPRRKVRVSWTLNSGFQPTTSSASVAFVRNQETKSGNLISVCMKEKVKRRHRCNETFFLALGEKYVTIRKRQSPYKAYWKYTLETWCLMSTLSGKRS